MCGNVTHRADFIAEVIFAAGVLPERVLTVGVLALDTFTGGIITGGVIKGGIIKGGIITGDIEAKSILRTLVACVVVMRLRR